MTRKPEDDGRFVIAVALLGTTPVAAASGEGQSAKIPVIADDQVCLQKIRSEERAHRIPGGLLAAIGFTESGRTVTSGQRSVWPWTVNAEGEGHFFEFKADAVKFVEDKLADGVRVDRCRLHADQPEAASGCLRLARRCLRSRRQRRLRSRLPEIAP